MSNTPSGERKANWRLFLKSLKGRFSIDNFKQHADSDTSDGYHTFDELYDHRIALFITLMQSHPSRSWYSDKHEDGTMYDGWFIAGMTLPAGDISYHLPIRYFVDLAKDGRMKYLKTAPKWDGHTPEDVVKRLNAWLPSREEINYE